MLSAGLPPQFTHFPSKTPPQNPPLAGTGLDVDQPAGLLIGQAHRLASPVTSRHNDGTAQQRNITRGEIRCTEQYLNPDAVHDSNGFVRGEPEDNTTISTGDGLQPVPFLANEILDASHAAHRREIQLLDVPDVQRPDLGGQATAAAGFNGAPANRLAYRMSAQPSAER